MVRHLRMILMLEMECCKLPDYYNGVPDIEILGEPKTVRIQGQWKGTVHSAQLECWILALVEIMTSEQKDQFFSILDSVQGATEESWIKKPRVVAEIPMVNMKGG